jgi:uncharacterized protein (DUF488 family)
MSKSAHSAKPETIWTIGHSTRPLEEFLSLLAGSRIEAIADVRSFPGSRKYPQLARALSQPHSPGTRSAISGCAHWAVVDESFTRVFMNRDDRSTAVRIE